MAEKRSNSPTRLVKAAPEKVEVVSRSDKKETAKLVKAGYTATANAIRASRALGLVITYMQNGIIYKEYPDGRKEQIESGEVKKAVVKRKGHSLKKGMVLHAKK